MRLSRNLNWPESRAAKLLSLSFVFFLVKGLAWLAVGGLALAGLL